MPIARITARWTGITGAPGYSNFHFDGGTGAAASLDACAAAVRGFFDAAKAVLAPGVTIEVQADAGLYDETTGQLVDLVGLTPPAPVTTVASGSYAGPVGAVVHWITGQVVNGRRLRGRTFIVPAHNNSYEANGTLTPAALSTLNTAAATLSGAGFDLPFGIWRRPVGGAGGAFAEVTSHRVPDMVAVLRSRRD